MNVAEILYECPSGTKLYSSIFGELSLLYVQPCSLNPIFCKVISSGSTVSFTEDGKCSMTDAEHTLFPSKIQRDWSKFVVPDKVFKPFDKVLVRDSDEGLWKCDFFSHKDVDGYYCLRSCWKQCIHYEGNEHLLGTTKSSKNLNNEKNIIYRS